MFCIKELSQNGNIYFLSSANHLENNVINGNLVHYNIFVCIDTLCQ